MPTQGHYATRPDGTAVWVYLTESEQARLLDGLPTRSWKWKEAIRMREDRQPLPAIYNRLSFMCEYDEFERGLSTCWQWWDTEKMNYATRRAGGRGMQQAQIDPEVLRIIQAAESEFQEEYA